MTPPRHRSTPVPASAGQTAPTRPSAGRRPARWPRIALVVTLGLVAASIGLGGALTCRPAWFVPTAIDWSRLKEDKNRLVAVLDDIGAALNQGRGIELVLDEAQINRWVTARREIWPEVEAGWLEPFRYPQVTLLDGNRLRLGALAERWGLRAALSATLRIQAVNHEVLIARDEARIGVWPAPTGWVTGLLRDVLGAGDGAARVTPEGAVALRNEWVWRNGERRFRIERLIIERGSLRILLAPAD